MANLGSVSRLSLQGTPVQLQQRSKTAQGGLLGLAAELGSVAHVVTSFAGMRDAREKLSWKLASRFLKATEAKRWIALWRPQRSLHDVGKVMPEV